MAVEVISTLKQKNGAAFPIVENSDIKGGIRVVADSTAADAISLHLQEVNLAVFRLDTGKLYRITATGTPPTYQEVLSSGIPVFEDDVAADAMPSHLQHVDSLIYRKDTGKFYIITATGTPPSFQELGGASLDGDVVGQMDSNSVIGIRETGVESWNRSRPDGLELFGEGSGFYPPEYLKSLVLKVQFGVSWRTVGEVQAWYDSSDVEVENPYEFTISYSTADRLTDGTSFATVGGIGNSGILICDPSSQSVTSSEITVSGDVSGSITNSTPSLTVDKIKGNTLNINDSISIADGQALVWDNANTRFVNQYVDVTPFDVNTFSITGSTPALETYESYSLREIRGVADSISSVDLTVAHQYDNRPVSASADDGLSHTVTFTTPFTTATFNTVANLYSGDTESGIGVTKSLTYTMTKGPMTRTKTTSVVFGALVFYGVSNASSYDEAFIEGLSGKVLKTSKSGSFSMNPGSGQYAFICMPVAITATDPSFSVGGFSGGFSKVGSPVSVTNQFGIGMNYHVYRSDNTNLGSIVVTTS